MDTLDDVDIDDDVDTELEVDTLKGKESYYLRNFNLYKSCLTYRALKNTVVYLKLTIEQTLI